ncbi:MAG: methyltransferase domain-containing protein, partial [Planctomycetota bacterium]
MKTKFRFLTTFAFLSIILCTLPVGAARSGSYDRQARQILEASNIKGGLIVHVGCGDGKLTAALHADESYLVHGLETDGDKVRQARE